LKVSSISLPPLFCPCFGRLYVYKAWGFWGTLHIMSQKCLKQLRQSAYWGQLFLKRISWSYGWCFNLLQVGPAAFGASAQYIRHFSSKSQGRITGKLGRYI
jgi:hypothetical protein